MRISLDIDDDVLLAAKDIARRRRVSVAKVLSELARQALVRPGERQLRAGIPLFPVQPSGGIVTPELVCRLLGEDTNRDSGRMTAD